MSKRLILVEDDATLARAVGRLLRRGGYEVFLAGTCAEARLASGSFSLGVFDVDLPDGCGIDLARELHQLAVVRRCLFFSGTPSAADRSRAMQLGPFVGKADGFPALRLAIEATLFRAEEQVVGAESSRFGESSTPPPSGVRSSRRDRT
jgi:two-component system response regulator RegA